MPDQSIRIYIMSFKSFTERMQNQVKFIFENDEISIIRQPTYLYNPLYDQQVESDISKNPLLQLVNDSKTIAKNLYGFFNCKTITALGISIMVAAGIAYNSYRN